VITDKVDGGYLPSYLRIAADLGPGACVLELGVYQGASLRLWQALFPYGEVTGVDCNPEATWPAGTNTVVMRQEDPELPAALVTLFKVQTPFSLIVDDASHMGVHTEAAFRNLWPLLAPGGYYVIEDWMIGLPEFKAHPMHDPLMEDTVSVRLRLLSSKDADCDEITYRFGLCIVHKRITR